MRAWGSCAVSVLASATHSARAFVPAASFRGAPLLSRGLRRPLHSSSSSYNSRVAQHPEGLLWVVQRRGGAGAEPAAGIWQQGGRVRLLCSMSSSSSSSGSSSGSGGAVQETQVEPTGLEEWSVTKVCVCADSLHASEYVAGCALSLRFGHSRESLCAAAQRTLAGACRGMCV